MFLICFYIYANEKRTMNITPNCPSIPPDPFSLHPSNESVPNLQSWFHGVMTLVVFYFIAKYLPLPITSAPCSIAPVLTRWCLHHTILICAIFLFGGNFRVLSSKTRNTQKRIIHYMHLMAQLLFGFSSLFLRFCSAL